MTPTNPSRARQVRDVRLRRSRLAAGLVVVVLLMVAIVGVEIVARTPTHAALPGETPSSGAGTNGQPLDTAAFATGACMAFGPTAGDRHKTVFLDAGHGGPDPGGVGITTAGQTIYEADETLPVELDTMAILRAQGYRVVVSRTQASTVLRLGPADTSGSVLSLQGAHDDVVARDVCANDAKADVLVGIYFDAGGSALNAGSITAYDAVRPFSAANQKLADLLQSNVLADMNAQGWGIPDDGVVTDASLGSIAGNPADGGLAAQAATYDHLLVIGPAMAGYFSTPSLMPGAVIEPLYITDPLEGSIVASAQGQKVIAEGIATAVEHYFEPPAASPSASTTQG